MSENATVPVAASPRQKSPKPRWPFNSASFDPLLDYENDVADAFKDVENIHLSKNTSLYALIIAAKSSHAQESILDEREVTALLSSRGLGDEISGLQLFAVSRLFLKPSSGLSAEENERGRLRISKQVFRLLLSTFDVPAAFVTALARPYMVCGTGFRRLSPQIWDYWCLVPLRVVAPCRVTNKKHTESTAGSNQLDPFHYIHLSGAKADIRGSYIGLFIRHGSHAERTTILSINLLDSRLRDLIEEPLNRARNAVVRWTEESLAVSPRFIHVIYISSILRWWNNVLLCFNQELVTHEKKLQEEIAAARSAFSNESKDINTSLHIMAAHLHRYKSELHRLESILLEIQSLKFDAVDTAGKDASTMNEERSENLEIEQLRSQLNAIMIFSDELGRKIQNILTLLFNQIQVTNDRTMQLILTAAQKDNKISQNIAYESHELARSMKNDGVAMKTLAIVTTLFLPGTFFSAFFSMPFFNQTEYLTTPTQVWIWTVLTVVITILAFGTFSHITKRQRKLPLGSVSPDVESNGGEIRPLSSQP